MTCCKQDCIENATWTVAPMASPEQAYPVCDEHVGECFAVMASVTDAIRLTQLVPKAS